ncbi:glycoside hydrolase family 19 [Segniliparus rotundus DSM 44985]|uniref:Glycoside hydrolase family 19 n=1 Tax=Segniliparus rotundus (strain ATCC BAA-972 / CDC 1076 / CIP 108378 / DSM 44985 / JCM 13578) TaxID=640132 RepID=D6Z8B3_SEGRD|nr:glycoside hydrolase family 19 protein [Segniliparus rotundus]ADG98193.1 glycoside hydrolase family 19 [Segniliparus rotundus DSM 44985]
MADWSDEILASAQFWLFDGPLVPALPTFRQYIDKLNQYRPRLEAQDVKFPKILDHDGVYWETEYHKDDKINIKAFRDDAANLHTAGQEVQAQLDLIRQTEDLPHHWNDNAMDTALENYKNNKTRMDNDRAGLVEKSQEIAQIAENIEKTLKDKATTAQHEIGNLVCSSLRNNLPDFETRLRTGCEAMEANNQGGSGPFGLGTNQHRYQHHGSGGDTYDWGGAGENWSAADVRNDLRNSVVGAIATVAQTLEDSNKATEDHLRDCFQTLLTDLGAGAGGTGSTNGVTEEQLHEIFPYLPMDKVREYLPGINAAMRDAGIETPQQKAAFLATFAVETSELQLMKENRNEQSCEEMYGPEYAGKTFGWDTPRDPDTPPNSAIPQPYTNTSGQLGNTQPGDGYKYRGRGPFQLTGRANYRAAGAALGLDLENHPELAEVPENGFRIAAWYYNSHPTTDGSGRSLNEAAEQGDFAAVTTAINGGLTGYAERKKYFDTATRVLNGN